MTRPTSSSTGHHSSQPPPPSSTPPAASSSSSSSYKLLSFVNDLRNRSEEASKKQQEAAATNEGLAEALRKEKKEEVRRSWCRSVLSGVCTASASHTNVQPTNGTTPPHNRQRKLSKEIEATEKLTRTARQEVSQLQQRLLVRPSFRESATSCRP